mmetsp:Transcript_27104/g.54533  ORF Transcript_27104/g.54533 Transcript_27104/m.54533 type:complete len:99 (+) Transcript_27104:37-333(+)|eukprot:CAMPEP_0174727996 /NCGR_PEP_ID=MMETSP1094-20130205/50870_1 /TAXON_ID=156173 /ORGANISM="Chrysochromulina brevifilum, Strain UTEX LB 985" /LENGTH=98 /DNA_ID=CAMNT_0015929843 /DNA_START=37 /DNA_END=333 /DNA_ORIENTATION=-
MGRSTQVGLYYSGVTNGVGGRKTRTNRAQKRARALNDAINGQRCERLLRRHDSAAVATANAQLVRVEQPLKARSSSFLQFGMRTPSHCEPRDESVDVT